MHVFGLVARDARNWQFERCGLAFRVALFTSDDGVGTFESEVSVAGVIKTDQLPIDRVVAATAIVAEPAFVMLVLMARRAGNRSRLEVRCLVTISADDLGVFANKRKSRLVVIERQLLPIDSVVAGLTLGA